MRKINPKSSDIGSFKYSILISLHYYDISFHLERISKLKPFENKYDFKNITDNELFRKTIKTFFSDKCTYVSKISLVHNDNVISDDQELADPCNKFF